MDSVWQQLDGAFLALGCLNTERISAPYVHMSDGCMDVIAVPAQVCVCVCGITYMYVCRSMFVFVLYVVCACDRYVVHVRARSYIHISPTLMCMHKHFPNA